ncbi:benzoate-CoA ligase family protein [Alkalihalobacillus deserti]|uniref:benzoate-CoA ligase family protein n=1 Tax=Alkalihalobacillus deserti TaxID=2879466 RepID=UPI001D143F31|nr:benzoate-CoA ligase family protein [Alkalihalobacillus deserti]
MIEPALNLRGIKEHYNAASRFIEDNVRKGLGNKVAIIFDDEQLTYNDLLRRVNQFGSALRNVGVESENRILLLTYDSPEFAVSFFGAMKIGAIPIPVNTMLQPNDYEYLLNNSRAKVLVIHEDFWDEIKEIRERFIYLKQVIVISENVSKNTDVIDFLEFIDCASEDLETYYSTSEDPGFWLYSSGSTGNPKGVIHHQKGMEVAFDNYAKQVLQITENDTTFSASKLFFAYGLGNGMYFPFGAGGTAILMKERPTPEKVFEKLIESKPTIFFGVPTLYGAMINYVEKTGIVPDLSSVRVCVSAGEALPGTFMSKWKDLFGLDILDGIGSTEALHIFLSNRMGDIKAGSTGKIVPGYEARILNDQAIEVGPNEIGDLVIKGESLTGGYWCNLEENHRKFYGEWMHTGDKYYQDEDGYFWYSGRSDDMLKVGGIWVSPIEIETVLFQHEKVLEVAVIGKKTENNLVFPKAFIVLKDGVTPSEELSDELKLFVKTNLAPYKYPREIEFKDELPKTATGKVQRFRLRV